jgi:predicted DNA-binding protein YlxM (UPF0122 family)
MTQLPTKNRLSSSKSVHPKKIKPTPLRPSSKCDHNLILDLARQQTYTLSEIGRKFNISREAVRQIVKRSGLPTDVRKIRRDYQQKQVRSLVEQGKSRQEIMKETGLPYNTVCGVLKTLDIEITHSSTLTFDGKKAIDLAGQDYTVGEIAKAVGTRYYNVLNFFNRRGVKIQKGYQKRLSFNAEVAEKLAAERVSLGDIAIQLGAKSYNIKMYFERHNIDYLE